MNKCHVLLLGSDAERLAPLSDRLHGLGQDLLTQCHSEPETVAFLDNITPDIILAVLAADGEFPDLDAAGRIAASCPAPVTIVADGSTPPGAATDVLPIHSCLTEPFSNDDLGILLERALLQQELRQHPGRWQHSCSGMSERHSFIEAVLSHIQSGIVVVDPAYRIRLVNPYAERSFQVTARDVYGRDLSTLCQPFADAVRNNGIPDEVTCSRCSREHVVGFKLFAITGDDGSSLGQIISFLDLTEIIKARREMMEKERLATLGEFVAKVAHEIRNPLFGMTAICQILSQELTLEGEHRTLLDSLLREAWRLKQLVDELLDCSRELRLNLRLMDLADFLADSARENESIAREQQIELRLSLPDTPLMVMADGDRILQVLLNLIKNGAEACAGGGTVSISLRTHDGMALCRVEDTGEGIQEARLDRVFDVFYTTKRQGTGLGLAISKNIIEGHGGTITAANNENGGASFSFTLPLAEQKP